MAEVETTACSPNVEDAPSGPGLYEIGFPNGRAYIGMTTKSVRVRLIWHLNAARRGGSRQAVHAALAKYAGQVTFRTLHVGDGQSLHDAEVEWIAARKLSGVALYNLTTGGEGTSGFRHGPAVRVKQSVSAQKSWTEDRKRAASEALLQSATNQRLRSAQKKSWTIERRAEFGLGMRKRCPSRKLSQDDVLWVAERLRAAETCASLARCLNVTPEAISAIKTGKNWGYLTGFGLEASKHSDPGAQGHSG